MAQEAQAQAFALAGALDDAGDVGHHERAVVAVAHDAYLGLHGGEGIVGNLGAGRRYGGEQRALAGVGEAHEAHVGQQLQLQHHTLLDGGLAGLGVARGAVGGALEVPVAQAAAAAAQQLHELAVVGHLREVLAVFCVVHHRAAGHVDDHILAVLAEAAAGAAALAVAGEDVAAVFQGQQRPHVAVAAQDYVAAAAAVAAVGAAFGHILGAVEVARAGAALTRAAQYLDVVYEV